MADLMPAAALPCDLLIRHAWVLTMDDELVAACALLAGGALLLLLLPRTGYSVVAAPAHPSR